MLANDDSDVLRLDLAATADGGCVQCDAVASSVANALSSGSGSQAVSSAFSSSSCSGGPGSTTEAVSSAFADTFSCECQSACPHQHRHLVKCTLHAYMRSK